jgi:hypothetical protein
MPDRTAQKNTIGGFITASIYSGATAPGLTGAYGAVAVGSDVLLFSGQGRLDLVMTHQATQSGLAVVFYDAGAPVSGGPLYTSGHRVVGVIPPVNRSTGGAVSGQTNPVDAAPGVPIPVSIPFFSGLCVNSRSGQPGFSVSWTPEKYSFGA